MSSDDVSQVATEAECLFHQHADDMSALLDSHTLSDICAAAFADCE